MERLQYIEVERLNLKKVLQWSEYLCWQHTSTADTSHVASLRAACSVFDKGPRGHATSQDGRGDVSHVNSRVWVVHDVDHLFSNSFISVLIICSCVTCVPPQS